MALVLDGSAGVSGVDGTASNPSYEGTDSNTGIFFPAADTVAIGTGGTEALRVNSSQNVGIGTTSQTAALDVVKPSFSGGPLIGARFNTSNFRMGFGVGNSNGFPFLGVNVNNAANDNGTFDINGYASRLRLENGVFQVQTSSASGTAGGAITWTTPLTLDASGNWSLGTTAVNARVTIATSEAKTVSALVTNFGTSTGGSSDFQLLVSRSAAGSGAYYSLQCVEQNVAVRDIVLQPSGGNLGVGSTSPVAVLDVVQPSASANGGRVAYFRSTASGDVANNAVIISKFDNNTTTSQIFMKFEVNNTATSCGRINANGANTAAFGSTSDQRVKENIEALPSQLQNILALRPVEFDYIESYGGGHQIGFIAQEMQEVYPDVVSADDSEEQILSITGWSKTEARLVKAIQEQQAMIDEMKAEIAALKAQP